MPGPFWAIAMLILPVARVKPSAIIPPEHSCAQSQKVIPASGNRSEIGIMAEPMIPKACSIPCICRTLMKASSVVIFMGCSLPNPCRASALLHFILEVVPVIECPLPHPPKGREHAVGRQCGGKYRQLRD